MQFLLRKSDDDDALVAMLRKQLGREDHGAAGGDELSFLRHQNGELQAAEEKTRGTKRTFEDWQPDGLVFQAQLERQAQIMLQLRPLFSIFVRRVSAVES